MLNVHNWEVSRARYDAYWDHALTGRAVLNLSYPLDTPTVPVPDWIPETSLYDKWENYPRILNNFVRGLAYTGYAAEGYPRIFVNMGPGFLAPMIGGSYQLAKDTVWFENEPVIRDYDTDLDKVRLYPDCDAYRHILQMTEYYASRAEGRYMTSITDLGGTMDVAASLRGNETLIYDIYDNPEGILALTERIDGLWVQAYQQLKAITDRYQSGTDSWHNLYCSGTTYPLQCDFCAMLSPGQFDKFVMPSLIRHCAFLEHGEYHLDGPDCVCHVPSLLSVPGLDAIQWVPGDGAPPTTDPRWFPMYRQIQDAGTNLIFVGETDESAKVLLRQLDQTKLFIAASCKSQAAAEEVVTLAEALA